jgi:hypothetical protein
LALLHAAPVGRRSEQAPLQQFGVLPEQLLPHEPQLVVVFSAVQMPGVPQQPCPDAHVVPHEPQLVVVFSAVQMPGVPQQPCPDAHVVPHEPQLVVVFSAVQTPPQQPSPVGQPQVALSPVPHTLAFRQHSVPTLV